MGSYHQGGFIEPKHTSWALQNVLVKLFFLTHGDERAPAAAAPGERRKSVQALRSIDLQTRSADLDVFVCIATDKTPLLSPPVEFNHWNQLRFSEEYPRGHAALGPRLYATDCCD